MIRWKELKEYLEEQGIKEDDVIAQLEIGETDNMDQIDSYFDYDKDDNRRLYVRFLEKGD